MFPLPLTAFEEYMLRDDRPGYPATVFFRLQFRGHLLPGPFEAAVAAIASRHPLLGATVQWRRGHRPRWVDRPGGPPAVHWHAPAGAYGYPSAPPLDPTQEPGVRFWVTDHATGHDLVIQAHHATSDARGVSQMAEELLIAYALRCGDAATSPPLPRLTPQRLRRRGAPRGTWRQCLKKLRWLAEGLCGVCRFVGHRPVPLVTPAPPIDESQPPTAPPAPLVHEFAPAQTAQILAAAKAQSATVNDLLVCVMLQTLAGWRHGRELGSNRDWLRLAIPVNLRLAGDEQMPMANAVSMVFVDRRPTDITAGNGLLRSVQRELMWAKRGGTRHAYLHALRFLRFVPGGLSAMLRADKCRATCVLSNLGPVLVETPLPRQDGRVETGNVVLEAIDFVPPLRPHVHAAFGVCTYAGRLRVLLNAHPQALPAGQSQDLLAQFAAQLRRAAEAAAP